MKPAIDGLLGYYINLDERGDFFADVRDLSGRSVFEIHTDEQGRIDLIDDGFMADKTDLAGLRDYLAALGVVRLCAEILPCEQFERHLEPPQDRMVM